MMSANLPSTVVRTSPFDDGRGLYPDRVTAAAPIGMRARIHKAAEQAGTTSAAFIREAIEARLRQAVPGAKEA